MAINDTGYASNQFLNISAVESQTLSRTENDNPEFMYPGKYIPNVYDDLSKGPLRKTVVQRGFIRGIFPDIINKFSNSDAVKKKSSGRYTGIDTPVRRCFFQFNPSMILRTVQASSTTLNPLLQNPTQLLQAIPGQASFEFQLLFNREYEVAGQKYRNANGQFVDIPPFKQLLDNYGSPDAFTDTKDPTNSRASNVYKQEHVGDLGVLVDLYVLDSIIGQSITSDTVQSILAYWEATKQLRGTGEKDADGKEINPYAGADFEKDGKFSKGLNNVLGNSAFLNPMPVRIVFSSLFMVEGFVTASNVAFHKFSENMVPTVCQVTLSVQALYIGFARKNSYITQQLEEQITTQNENNEADSAASKTARNALQKQTQAQLVNMGFSFEGWGRLTTFIDYTLEQWSLNKWWKKIYDTNKTKYEADPDTFPDKLKYSLCSPNLEEELRFWTSKAFKDLVKNTAITEVKIESLKLFFYDKNDPKSVPKKYNAAEIQRVSNLGELEYGFHGGLKPIAKALVYKTDDNIIDVRAGVTKTSDLNDIESEKLVKGKKDDPYETKWITGDMERAMGSFDKDRITKNASKYFGDNLYVVAQLVMSASFSSANEGTKSEKVIKTVVNEFDPNKLFNYYDTFNLDFGFWWNNNNV